MLNIFFVFYIHGFSYSYILSEYNHSAVFQVTLIGIVLWSNNSPPHIFSCCYRHFPYGSAKWEICHKMKTVADFLIYRGFHFFIFTYQRDCEERFSGIHIGCFHPGMFRAKYATSFLIWLSGAWSLKVTSGEM